MIKLTDPTVFFKNLKTIVGSLDQVQVDTVNRLLFSAGVSKWSVGHLAYALATAWHEARFKPQPEWGKGAGKSYAKPGKYGQPQYGRGLVQLTWDFNYEWADKACSKAGLIEQGDLLKNFDLALRPDIAAFILIQGMEEGAFCRDKLGRHSLKRHIRHPNGTTAEFTAARRIINGMDKAEQIAAHADRIKACLIKGGWG